MRSVSRVMIFILLIFLVAGFTQAGAQFFLWGGSLEGQTASDFSLKTLSDDTVQFSQYRKGRPAILFFWATWCPHCWAALKTLTTQFDDIEASGTALLLINVGESKQAVQAQMNRRQISFNVLLDQQSRVAEQYQVMGIPTFVLIDQQGVIVKTQNAFPSNYLEFFKD
jgi:peroxiredoxin